MENLIERVKKYFKPEELVSKKHFETFENKDDIYNLFDHKLLETIVILREKLGKSLTINDWSYSKAVKVYNYRGYRWTDCSEGAPKSAHKQGMAIDFIIKGMSASEFRKWIKENSDILPYNIRIEDGVSWNHIDTRSTINQKIYFFNA